MITKKLDKNFYKVIKTNKELKKMSYKELSEFELLEEKTSNKCREIFRDIHLGGDLIEINSKGMEFLGYEPKKELSTYLIMDDIFAEKYLK